jgi:hypothetical protein
MKPIITSATMTDLIVPWTFINPPVPSDAEEKKATTTTK